VYARDGYKCQYCGQRFKPQHLTIDHVIPKSHWNPKRYSFKCNSFENCVAACIKCNQKKANRTPAQAGMTLLTKPKALTNAEVFQRKFLLEKSIPSQWRNFITDV
jgi:5-methylcytosine-specific restriction endonuclease McrA